jgi:hypothetical protein
MINLSKQKQALLPSAFFFVAHYFLLFLASLLFLHLFFLGFFAESCFASGKSESANSATNSMDRQLSGNSSFRSSDLQLTTIQSLIYKEKQSDESVKDDKSTENKASGSSIKNNKKDLRLFGGVNFYNVPKLKTNFVAEILVEDSLGGSNQKQEFSKIFGHSRIFNQLDLGNNLKIHSQLSLSKMSDGLSNSRYFNHQTAFLQELNIGYYLPNIHFLFGKMNLDFATPSIWNRGVTTINFAKDYLQIGKIASGSILFYGDEKTIGRYSLGVSFFKNDRKYLDNSLFYEVPTSSKESAKIGDTNIWQSFNISANTLFNFSRQEDNGKKYQEKLSYHVSFLNTALNHKYSTIDHDKIRNQHSWSATMNYQKPITNNIMIDFVTEFVTHNNYLGNKDYKALYFLNNAIIKHYSGWQLFLSSNKQSKTPFSANSSRIRDFETTVGYQFKKTSYYDNMLVQLGYNYQRQNLNEDNKINLTKKDGAIFMLRYNKNF